MPHEGYYMKLNSIDFFGLSVTYRVEARKAGPTIFLSLRSSDGVHIDGAGGVCAHADSQVPPVRL